MFHSSPAINIITVSASTGKRTAPKGNDATTVPEMNFLLELISMEISHKENMSKVLQTLQPEQRAMLHTIFVRAFENRRKTK